MALAETPEPPYFAVIFTSRRKEPDPEYDCMAERMETLAAQQPGFLGADSVRQGAVGITVSYWRDLASIHAWKMHAEHREAQRLGRERWYRSYTLRIARVERETAIGMASTEISGGG